jgi:hypothetical protein
VGLAAPPLGGVRGGGGKLSAAHSQGR